MAAHGLGPASRPTELAMGPPPGAPLFAGPSAQRQGGSGRGIGPDAEKWVGQFNSMSLNRDGANQTVPTPHKLADGPVQIDGGRAGGPTDMPQHQRIRQPPGRASRHVAEQFLRSAHFATLGRLQAAHEFTEIARIRNIYEDDFDHHMTQWMQNEGTDTDFAQQMDEWMKKHGKDDETARGAATLSESADTPSTSDDEATSARARKQEEDHNLAAVAKDILRSVSDNRSQKFMNSDFLGLMNAIASGRTVVDGDKFVIHKAPDPSNQGTNGAPTQTAAAKKHVEFNLSGVGAKGGSGDVGIASGTTAGRPQDGTLQAARGS